MRFIRSKVKDKPMVNPMLKKITVAIDKRLHRLSAYLQRRSDSLSIKTRRVVFFSFCLLFGTVSLIVLLKGFSGNKSSVIPTSITVPAYAGKSNDDLPNGNIISQEEFEHIQAFEHYLDSLKGTKTGKLLFDSIMIARPHLLDSILLLENMYQIQSLKR